MKKLFALLLALVMVFGLGVTAADKAMPDIYVYNAEAKYVAAYVTDDTGAITGFESIFTGEAALGQVGLDEVREEARQDAEQRQDAHGDPHADGNFLHMVIFLRKLSEEHRLRNLNKGCERQRRGDKADHRDQEEADVVGLYSLLIGCLVNEPFGSKAVEGRDAADGKGAHKEENRGLGHALGKAAQFAQIRGAGLVQHRAGAEEQAGLGCCVLHDLQQAF